MNTRLRPCFGDANIVDCLRYLRRAHIPIHTPLTPARSFFQNTGAVAGVFSAVGIVALVLIVVVVTNAVRRRRAKKLDREIAEAAAEAAYAQPAFTDDDYFPPDDRLGNGGSSNGGGDLRSMTTTGYSDTTHGTFAQPPMGHGESYNMAELNPYEYGAAGVGVGAAAGAAGVGAMGLNRARSQTQPYNAFAGPAPDMPNPYDPNNVYNQQQDPRYRSPGPGNEMDLLSAAGLGGGAAAGYGAAHQGYGPGPNQPGANLGRNPSLGPSQATSASEYSSYAQHPQAGYQHDYSSYPAQPAPGAYGNPFQQGPPQGYQGQPPQAQSRPLSMGDPYGGYVEEPQEAAPGYTSPTPPGAGARAPSPGPERLLGGNFASPPASSEGHEHDYQDEDDYAYEPKRVLKVRARVVRL